LAGKKRVGIVLFQLGGPDSLESVEPFLLNLFLDPDIIPLGRMNFIRRPIAKWIARKRAKEVAKKYGEIGGRSPIRALTERQRDALAEALSAVIDSVIVIAMRYWHPLTAEAVETLRRAGPLDELVLLPLYPHYSFATTRSSLKEWQRVYVRAIGEPPEKRIEKFYDHPLYIRALTERIAGVLRQFPASGRAELLFSAHGLPMSLVNQGDPYPKQIDETVRLVCEDGAARVPGWPKSHRLCYQSRLGREKWLEPSLHETLEKMGREGVKDVLVVPISFVTEHIETLHEINIEAREEAAGHGVETFRMMPAVGDSPLFIGALADLVLRAVGIEAREVSVKQRT
jgi:protoporphyrin/coproporphyrin ferrochelatase